MSRTRIRPVVSLVAVCLTGAALVAACGGSGSTTTTASSGGGSAGTSSTSSTSSSTTTTAAGAAAGGCPEGTYVLQDPGSGLPFQIATGGTGTVITVDGDDNATISFDDYATASGSTTGGSFTIDAQGVITARVVASAAAPGEYELTDVDAAGITGRQTITLDSGESFTIEGADFTQLAQGLAPYGPGAVLSCSPAGDLQASAGPITQTYERQSG